jgi:hypothetical protein
VRTRIDGSNQQCHLHVHVQQCTFEGTFEGTKQLEGTKILLPEVQRTRTTLYFRKYSRALHVLSKVLSKVLSYDVTALYVYSCTRMIVYAYVYVYNFIYTCTHHLRTYNRYVFYLRTKVLSYFRTKVRTYFRTFVL